VVVTTRQILYAACRNGGRLAARWRRLAQELVIGGWADHISLSIARNLRWFWFDGVFARSSEVIVTTFFPLFLLALGASRAQIGLVSSLSSLSAALLLLPGATLVERWGHRKQAVVCSGGGVSRITLLLLALLPLVLSGPAAITLVIALAVIRIAFNYLSLPAWVSLTADMVPLQWRGRYLAFRNLSMEVSGMVTIFLMGYLIARWGGVGGYQLAIGIAFVIGTAATYCFARLDEPPLCTPAADSRSRLPFWSDLSARPGFGAFCATAAVEFVRQSGGAVL
jgi:hypothetical protein